VRLHGLVKTAELRASAPDSEQIEMILRVQGVGPGQPRQIVVPFALLVADESLDPDRVSGRAFQAEVEPDEEGRFLASQITFSARMLRSEE
jgi:hypothetical protein